MGRKDGYISASEVNKYTYCPYQWYYEKKWGAKALREMAAEKNRELGLTDTTAGNFKKGLSYHSCYHRKLTLQKWCTRVALLLLAGAVLYALAVWYGGGFYG